ncbi:MAG: type II secretion system protein [Planctomycetota bacterium]
MRCARINSRTARVGRRNSHHRWGFTLIEMLISVGLVLLMMSLFAQIFQMAGASISKQRGLMENDQRARTLQTIVKGDLDKRTFSKVLPFAANEDTTQGEAELSKRRGYFYYSENDPNNQLDDVLQFTMQSSIIVYNKDPSPYYGRALQLTTFDHPNQPDTDDALRVPNNTGLSTLAEISYFVRNGNLYRRQLLIREPIPLAGSTEQPQDANGDNFFDPNASGTAAPVVLYPSGVTVMTATNFWNDFDYSAFLTFERTSPGSDNGLIYTGTSNVTGARFIGVNALNNDGTAAFQLGKPVYRFGHQAPVSTAVVGPFIASEIGQPKEYTDTSATAEFIGRFTLEECSSAGFTYPQQRGGDPMRRGTSLTLNADKVVTGFTGGPRRGEDLLMSNVHSFDVQVWDDAAGASGLGAFVDIGGTNAVDYAMTNNRHDNPIYGGSDLLYGPTTSASTNRVFDTWHPQFNLTTSNDPSPSPNTTTGQTIYDDPPFRPSILKAESVTGVAADTDAWAADTTYSVGDIRFPTGPPGATAGASPARLPYGLPFYYRCVGTTGMAKSALLAASEPSWPRIDGLKVIDNEVTWQAVENRRPLKAIKLEIRFVDTSTQQMRQLTIIQSLVD